MTIPRYPLPPNPGRDASQPGLYPLRPLRVGELLSAAMRIAVRHLAVLAPIALLVTVLASGTELAILAANGSLRNYAAGAYTALPANATPDQVRGFLDDFARHVLGALAASLAITLVAGPVLAGVATPFAAAAATSRAGTNSAGLARLRGRLPVLIGIGVLAGIASTVGFALLLVPGIIVWLMFLPAGPVAAMEGSNVGDSLRRARALTRGVKARLFGVMLLTTLIVGLVSVLVQSIQTKAVGSDPVRHLLIGQGLAAVASAVLTPWSSTVIAMLYVDLRMRREGLAQALLGSAR